MSLENSKVSQSLISDREQNRGSTANHLSHIQILNPKNNFFIEASQNA